MGFITPTHAWEETDSEVTVRVDIKGVPRSSLDVFASSCYLKVNAPPYLFSCDLEGEIDDAECVATVDAAGTDAEVRIVAPIMFPWTDVDAMTPRFEGVSRRGRTPLWLPATSMAWIDSKLSQPRDLPRLFIFPGRKSDALRHSPPPARPHETRDRPIGVHARSYVTCQGGFRRLREDPRRVSPAACHPPR